MAQAAVEHTHAHVEQAARVANLKFGMWLYLGSEVVIFATLIGAFAILRIRDKEAIEIGREALSIPLVSFNTFLLLASSWAMVMGLVAIQRDNRMGLVRWIGLTAILGAIFVALQYVEYQELAHEGITLYFSDPQRSAFGMRFYALTSFHGFHVIIGVIWALYLVFKGFKGVYSSHNFIGVEIFGLYWHFVDVVWIILFTLIYLI